MTRRKRKQPRRWKTDKDHARKRQDLNELLEKTRLETEWENLNKEWEEQKKEPADAEIGKNVRLM